MDQRTLSGEPTPSLMGNLLGRVLNYPVSDIPTQEDFDAWLLEQLREDPDAPIQPIGPPVSREERLDRQATQTGQGILDWLTNAAMLVNILRTTVRPPGRPPPETWAHDTELPAQELMGKQRGAETFGETVMERSRQASSPRWRRMEAAQKQRDEEIGRQLGEPTSSLQDLSETYLMGRRESSRPGQLAPEGNVRFPEGAKPPPDVVMPARLEGILGTGADVYLAGRPVPLPGGVEAQYVVVPSRFGYNTVSLRYGDKLFRVGEYEMLGEALAKARMLANRLDLAGKDLLGKGWTARPGEARYEGQRAVRMPWDRATQPPYIEDILQGEKWPGWWKYRYEGPGVNQ